MKGLGRAWPRQRSETPGMGGGGTAGEHGGDALRGKFHGRGRDMCPGCCRRGRRGGVCHEMETPGTDRVESGADAPGADVLPGRRATGLRPAPCAAWRASGRPRPSSDARTLEPRLHQRCALRFDHVRADGPRRRDKGGVVHACGIALYIRPHLAHHVSCLLCVRGQGVEGVQDGHCALGVEGVCARSDPRVHRL